MTEIKKGMSSEFADSDTTFPYNVFAHYNKKAVVSEVMNV